MYDGSVYYEEQDDKEVSLPCADKLIFDAKRQAEAAAVVAGYQHGTKLKAYKCRYCHLWHLASDFQEL